MFLHAVPFSSAQRDQLKGLSNRECILESGASEALAAQLKSFLPRILEEKL